LFGKQLSIDLGTVNARHLRGRGVVLQEPSVVAVSVDSNRPVEVGDAARRIPAHARQHRGRAPAALASSPTTKSPSAC
jgi:rod shape-determining protein MreB